MDHIKLSPSGIIFGTLFIGIGILLARFLFKRLREERESLSGDGYAARPQRERCRASPAASSTGSCVLSTPRARNVSAWTTDLPRACSIRSVIICRSAARLNGCTTGPLKRPLTGTAPAITAVCTPITGSTSATRVSTPSRTRRRSAGCGGVFCLPQRSWSQAF